MPANGWDRPERSRASAVRTSASRAETEFCEPRKSAAFECSRAGYGGDGEVKCRALALLRLDPDSTAVVSDDPFADGKADARTGDLTAVETFEDSEDSFVVFGRDALTVITNREPPLASLALRGQTDFWPVETPVLQRIRNQVLEQLHELCLANRDLWKKVDGDFCISYLDGCAEILDDCLHRSCSVGNGFTALAVVSRTGEGKQVLNEVLHAASAVHREPQKFVSLGIEFSLIVARE